MLFIENVPELCHTIKRRWRAIWREAMTRSRAADREGRSSMGFGPKPREALGGFGDRAKAEVSKGWCWPWAERRQTISDTSVTPPKSTRSVTPADAIALLWHERRRTRVTGQPSCNHRAQTDDAALLWAPPDRYVRVPSMSGPWGMPEREVFLSSPAQVVAAADQLSLTLCLPLFFSPCPSVCRSSAFFLVVVVSTPEPRGWVSMTSSALESGYPDVSLASL